VSTVSVVTPSGKGGKNVELPDEIFGTKVNIPLIHQVVVAQEAAARQGTHATKTRGAVRGGGKKPYRQKGTGRARQGSLRAPQYTGGGVVHGPVPRSYVQRTPKKMKAAALRGALSDRASHGRLAVVSSFLDGEDPSTKDALAVLRAAVGETASRLSRAVLVVVTADDELTRKSLRNAIGVRVLDAGQLNTYDVLVSDHVVFTQSALSEFVNRSGAASAAEDAASAPAAKATTGLPRSAKAKAAEGAPAAKAKAAAQDVPAAEAKAAAEDVPAAKAPRAPRAPKAAEDASAAEAKPAAKGKPAAKDDTPEDEQQ
jgi:large subunit ribosomal protein L4